MYKKLYTPLLVLKLRINRIEAWMHKQRNIDKQIAILEDRVNALESKNRFYHNS